MVLRKRPNPARLSDILFSFHFGFFRCTEDLRKRAENLQKLRRKKPERQPKNRPPNRPKKPRRNRYSVRTDSGPIALRAFWSMHVEAMNWSGMGHAEYAAAL